MWKQVIKTENGLGEVIVDRDLGAGRIRFTLIENHGLHIETKILPDDFTGTINFEATEKFQMND
jgi:hypothetical protein